MLSIIFAVACAVGTVMHFLYAPLGRPKLLAFLLPVSESVWEHFKLSFWPLCGAMLFVGIHRGALWSAILCACVFATLHSAGAMFGLFYLYVYGLGVGRNCLTVDICCYCIVMMSGFSVGLRGLALRPAPFFGILCILYLLAAAAAFFILSFAPPRLPVFVSKS